MILFALIVIWLLLIAFLVALCRIAAAADDRNDAATIGRYPTLSVQGPRAKLPGQIRWDSPRAAAARDLRTGAAGADAGVATARGGRGRGGRFVAGS
jgi:hypothetical protein